MSVLIYRDRETVGAAAATLFAASLMESPYLNIGLTYDSDLDKTFASLSAMRMNGLFSFEHARIYQLCEFVPSDENPVSIADLLQKSLLDGVSLSKDRYVVPFAKGKNWAQICTAFENDIFEHGGLDLALLALRPDGSLLYNLPGDELAPVTHVELLGADKVVSAGLATLMRAKKLLVVATGKDAAKAVSRALGGAISGIDPAGYLQLHPNITFLLDEEAASLL